MKHKRFIAFVCAFLLAAQLVPAAAFAQGTTYDTVRVPVEELLAAGDYVEGEALAIVRVGVPVDAAGRLGR